MKRLQQPQIIPSNQNLLYGILNKKNISKFLSKAKSHEEIKIVYFGTPKFSAYILEKLIEFCDSGTNFGLHLKGVTGSLPKLYSIQAVVTSPDKPVGRKQVVSSSPVSVVAQKYNIPILKPDRLDEEFIKSSESYLECDLFVVVSYGQILPKAILDIPQLGAINVHASLLPKYRGASPIQQAILNGDKETGVTIILMDEQLDHGPILYTKKISLSEQDTFETLSTKTMHVGAELLIENLPKFVERRIRPVRQTHAMASFCQRLTRDSGYFDINIPPSPEKLDRMIRAYYPWPGVWTKWKGKIVKFLPGDMLQMEGKKAISLKDFLNGYPDFPLKENLFEISR